MGDVSKRQRLRWRRNTREKKKTTCKRPQNKSDSLFISWLILHATRKHRKMTLNEKKQRTHQRVNCGKKKSNKWARIKQKRHTLNIKWNTERTKKKKNNNKESEEWTTARREIQSCIRVKTVVFQIKLPSWSFKSLLSHLEDVDYVRAHLKKKQRKEKKYCTTTTLYAFVGLAMRNTPFDGKCIRFAWNVLAKGRVLL